MIFGRDARKDTVQCVQLQLQVYRFFYGCSYRFINHTKYRSTLFARGLHIIRKQMGGREKIGQNYGKIWSKISANF